MALTNEQITAQNFKDFYGQIRPYLNGNVPTFANTFNKSDLYSTDEQLVGRWIDGKPLYQKTIEFTSLSPGQSQYQHNIANVDYINFVPSASYVYFANATWTMFGWNGNGTNYLANLLDITSSVIDIFLGGAIQSNSSKMIITLQYTKTTDSSMSISDGNEYSTDEQVVGHWIDGSPLYQKTIDLGVLPNNSTKNIPHGISNIKEVCSLAGAVYGFAGGVYYALPLPNVGTNNQYAYDIAFNIKGNDLCVVTQSDRTWLKGSVTICYTKN